MSFPSVDPGAGRRPALPEVPLLGGTSNRGQVVRVGDTVRRPPHATGASTRALLDHLESVGFDGAPRHLGTDHRGRVVLTYVVGDAVTRPYPAWAMTDAALRSVADLLRRYHAAVAGFDPSGLDWPRPVPAQYSGGLVSHNDPNLDNVIFRDGRAVALIDFDLASPGSALWDVAAAARLWAPLRLDTDIDDQRRGAALRRFRRFVDDYGLGEQERAALPAAVLRNHDWSYRIVQDGVRSGHEAFTEYWRSGAGARADRTRWWYGHTTALHRALVD